MTIRVRKHAYPATLYALFDVPPGATQAELHAAYRALLVASHPDVHETTLENLERYKALTAAWAQLKDPEARARYDAQLRLLPGQCEACQGAGRTFKPLTSFAASLSVATTVECAQCEGTGQKPVGIAQSAFPARAGKRRL